MQRERNREGWMRADEPNTTEEDDPEAAIGFVGEVCARAATVGEEGSEDVVVDAAGGAAGGFPSLAAPLT